MKEKTWKQQMHEKRQAIESKEAKNRREQKQNQGAKIGR